MVTTHGYRARAPSIFDGEAFADFIDAFVKRIEARVHGPVVKVENIPPGQKSENPVMGFHVDEYLLNRVTDGNNNVPHDVPHSEKRDFRFWIPDFLACRAYHDPQA